MSGSGAAAAGTAAKPFRSLSSLLSLERNRVSMSPPLLEIRDATKIYRGGFLRPGQQLVALQNFNLVIPEKPATITAIAGESGSGKTTLANLILGFIGL